VASRKITRKRLSTYSPAIHAGRDRSASAQKQNRETAGFLSVV
jgi:hypothetical protein